MKVREIQIVLEMEVAAGHEALDRDVRGGYCGDLLSDVMANAPQGGMWMTIQSHQNIVAVAVLRELSAIVLVNGRRPDEDTRKKANDEGVPLLLSSLSSFQLSGRLFELGVGRIQG